MGLVTYTNYWPHATIPAAEMICKETENHTKCMSNINYYFKTYKHKYIYETDTQNILG